MTMNLKKAFILTFFNHRLFALPAFCGLFLSIGSPFGELSYYTRKAPPGFTGWGTGQGAMRKSACLPSGDTPNAIPAASISLSFPPLRNTARNPTSPARKSSSLRVTCPAQNCLPDRKPLAGMFGATKWTAIFPCPHQKRGDFIWLMSLSPRILPR
ncbi:Uncharacterised protein [[Eubacterium] contortum]|uniref:Uncharacterized protein n=1 Tax=Faecalicatena contorta TaxID=39482 RepID=A0A174JII1_9FIRM|nr:Uncharacterised protein [[Eubacterium] contortum] [Faecalicatena contorta]